MRYEMQNYVKFTKRKVSNVGQKPNRQDDWKRERKVARQNKINLRKSVA